MERRIGENAYRIGLPHRYIARGKSATFNADHLKLSLDVPEFFIERQIAKSAPIMYDEEVERVYVIQDLLAHRRQRHENKLKHQYLCSWVGLPADQNSWGFEEDICHVSHWDSLIRRFREHQAASRGRGRRSNQSGRMQCSTLF